MLVSYKMMDILKIVYYRSRPPVQVEPDRSQSVGDKGNKHDQHLDSADPIGKIWPVVFKRVQLAFEVLVTFHH
jgi:hypothetical protein